MVKITTEEIEIKQNNPEMLKVQFAARKCYNIAEILNSIAWVLYIVEIVCLCLSKCDLSKNVVAAMESVIAVAISIVVWFCTFFVKKGAWLRGFFDESVFSLEPKKYSSVEGISIREFVEKLTRIFPKSYKNQVANTGNDIPPGVKSWYETPCYKNGKEAIFECQQQNVWFTEKHLAIKMAVDIAFVIANAAIFVWFLSHYGFGFDVAVCFFGIGIRCVERVYANCRFILKISKIDGIIESMYCSINQEAISNLQDNINELRGIPILGNNYLYTKCVKRVIDLYYKIKQ